MSSITLLGRPWRRVWLGGWFLGRLLNISKNRTAASTPRPGPLLLARSSATAYAALRSDPSPTAEESQDHSIQITGDDDDDDQEGRLVRSPAPSSGATEHPQNSHTTAASAVREAPAEHDLTAPLLDQLSDEQANCMEESHVLPICDEGEGEGEGEEENTSSSEVAGNAAVGSFQDEHRLDRDHIRLMLKRKSSSFLRRVGGVRKVALVLGTDLEMGINPADDQGLRPNPTPPTPAPKKCYLHFLLEEACKSSIVMLLLAAAILSFLIGFKAQGFKNGWHDGTAIVAAIFLLITVRSAANLYQAKRLEKELQKRTHLWVKVRRNGEDRFVEIYRVVEGDVVKLKKGSIVPADGVFVDGSDLVLEEVPNPKIDRDHNPFLFSGSRVMSGTGTMLAVSTVDSNSQLVKEHSRLDLNDPSLLEERVNRPSRDMDILVLVLSILILVLALVRVWHQKPDVSGEKPELKGEVPVNQVMSLLEKILQFQQKMIRVLTSFLTAMVIVLQHGVPFTSGLTLKCWNLKAVSVKIQNWWACATMGIVTILYVDLNCGMDQMEVAEVLIGERNIACPEKDSKTPDLVLESLHRAIEVSARVPDISASPRSRMLSDWANSKWDLNDKFGNNQYAILDSRKLKSGKKGLGVSMRKEGSADEERILYLHWKGAASSIIDMCSHYINQAGMGCSLDGRREMLGCVIKDMEERGLITIAFASREMDTEEIREDGLNLLAIVGLKFICSNRTKSAVRYFRREGIRVMLVSEDEPSALRSIVYELELRGVQQPNEEEDMQEITMREVLKPEENHSIVSSFKKAGEVVAVYGGGSTPDIVTLKEADLGITDSDKSTQMAKDGADMVLSRGITSLAQPLELGRCAYRNIQVFYCLQLSTWISWFVLTLVVTVGSGDSPRTPLQQIWVYAVMCFLGGLMMRIEWSPPSLIAQKPAPRTVALINQSMWVEIAGQVSCQLLVFSLFQFKGQDITGVSNGTQRAMTFASLTLCQVLNLIKATKTGTIKELAGVLRQHYWFVVILGVIVAAQVVLVQFAWSLTDGLPLSGTQWMLSCGIAVLPLVLHSTGEFLFSVMSIDFLPRLSGLSFWSFWMPIFIFSSILLVSATQIIQPEFSH
ncbi:hypothetical protein CDL15_Pgr023163 [Punica granatum]|uniref:Uncharacterized protein n=1 Tax=Punica granatum TaxID=22663 RepID=A0A218X5H3_PUNGR|nr:hypothetical protein CDL15_Pgr023163 [Punica granatum]PKI64228.1 hypothetical protein CRG98_015415 [Punica granatum]